MKINHWTANHTHTEIEVSDTAITVVERANVTPLLELNKIERESTQKARGLKKIGSVDAVTYNNWRKEWKKRGEPESLWLAFALAKLKDRDYSKFRTVERI